MSNARLQQFDRQLKRVVVSALGAYGFALQGRRTFARSVKHDETESVQLIEFQVGTKSFIGRFTVNLAIYHESVCHGEPLAPGSLAGSWDCPSDLVQRLGFFYQRPTGFWDRILGRKNPGPQDHWWNESADEDTMVATFQQIAELIVTKGLLWLNERTSRAAFRWALEELERRRQWKAALGSPGAAPYFVSRPFSGPA